MIDFRIDQIKDRLQHPFTRHGEWARFGGDSAEHGDQLVQVIKNRQ